MKKFIIALAAFLILLTAGTILFQRQLINFTLDHLSETVFTSIDADKNGIISLSEFTNIYKQNAPEGQGTENVSYFFNAFDQNQDEGLSLSEVQHFLSFTKGLYNLSFESHLEEFHKTLDISEDGYVQTEEAGLIAPFLSISPEALASQYDLNKDGLLDDKELPALLKAFQAARDAQ